MFRCIFALTCISLIFAPTVAGESQLRLRGYFALGDGNEYVSLSSRSGDGRWVPIGGRFEQFKLAQFDRAAGVLTLVSDSGEKRVISLEAAPVRVAGNSVRPAIDGAKVRFSPTGTAVPESRTLPREFEVVDVFPPEGGIPSAEGLDWEWIRSEANPMRNQATLPSLDESRKWANLTPAQKQDLVELYRQCGWALTVYVRRKGLVAAKFAAIPRPGETHPVSQNSVRRAVPVNP